MSRIPQRRLNHLLRELTPAPAPVGTLKLGDITYEVPASLTPSRLARSRDLLDINDPVNVDNLHFILQKYLLGQDVFLVSQPGPYARRLALTFASLINAEYEYIALHRDVGETELKQGREIRKGGNLVYVDSPAVSAVKHGRLLILEGIEKAERGIMPVLNNLLENREMNLDDGTHIIHPHRYAQLESIGSVEVGSGHLFVPAHKDFRVIAIAAPVPPYPGYPLDPPFRSRFQARFIDPVGSLMALRATAQSPPSSLFIKLRDLILSTQFAAESRNALETVSRSTLPPFPQTALAKLSNLISTFPPPKHLSPGQLARLFLTIHPGLLHASFQAWAMLSRQTEEAGLGELGSPSMTSVNNPIGLFGYAISAIERVDDTTARLTFKRPGNATPVIVTAPAGSKALRKFPFTGNLEFYPTDRFLGLLTCFLQAHALGWDISLIPPALPSTASTSTSTLVRVFGQVLGYDTEVVHMYKELGGRELVMRRKIQDGGATTWEASPLIEGAWAGQLLHLSGLDVIGSTAGSLARFIQDREIELWENKRIVAEASPDELSSGELSVAHPSFRIISTASKSIPLKDWLSDEHANMFFPIPSQPMDRNEELDILRSTGCSPALVETILSFAEKYRQSMSEDNVIKNRKLGTRSLVRIARRLALFPQDDDLNAIISRSLLAEFLPAMERMNLDALLVDSDIEKKTPSFNANAFVRDNTLVFPASHFTSESAVETEIPRFGVSQDPVGVASHVPHMDHFYDNSLQTGLMRDLAIDLELLGEHVVLLGNQGVGKNKIVDRLCQLLGRPREYIQLHRDTTVNQLMFTTSLEGGVLQYTDSPLLRAITFGRVIIIDEADKAPEHVVAIFRSLAGQREMTLSDGRRVRPVREREGDIPVHPNFRLILLANRPGYPFLGNHFLQVLGENFSAHSVTNPDQASERKLLEQLAPELSKDLILRLVGAFQDLRKGYDSGVLNYPYSLRELINLIRHLRAYPQDSLGDALRNVFDFDIYKPDTIDKLAEILSHHGLKVPHLGLDAAREAAKKKVQEIQFEPTKTDLSEPKEGKHDDKEHSGGNTYAGGTGGRDTAGLGGRGGYKRLFKGGDIKQVSDALKSDVPDHIKEKAREMARQELQRRLEELNMSASEARAYGELLTATQTHMLSLHDLLEHLAAKEEERVWVKRQTDGELDDSRLTEGLTGEATVYKRRGMEKPELGRPQIKPKRIRFIFDLSASMYRFQYDGRLQRSMETAAMLMETFERLSRKEKYVWDMYGHSGDGPDIPLVEADKPPTELRDRWKVVEKMAMIPQYAFAGDYTVEAIEKGVNEVGKYDADDWFVIAITDANFGRYQITPEDLTRAMNRNPKVHTALVCIGEGAEASWITKRLPGRGFRVTNTADIPTVLRSILSTMVDR
ncbi:von Willebrand factor A domain-containing protein 8 [Hypsizygus marmoreus]|uniref:von Willebrand factor A domain-containing protein 8 n=1 Tax=Hypsizygus marmoreus TaxID=39966 RepID=A0A369K3T0_HYPMA|nr:von Willebrand factor A domain-containing protein 8 [Hypsizygus marmoreus]